MFRPEDGLHAALVRRGMTRRAFLKFSAAMTAALALPATYAPRVAAAVQSAPRLPLIWLRGQACGGETEAFLAAAEPSVTELLLDLLSVDYHESLMASSGAAATAELTAVTDRYPNGFVAVIEGSVPTAEGGMACTVGGRPFRDVVGEVSAGAVATIAVGSCAFDGGAQGASGGQTGAGGADSIVAADRLVTLPGCPVNVENLAATIVHYLTFRELPARDGRGRPLFAYGGLVHNQCERRAHFEFGEFVLAWGDEAAQKGWCLYKMGCKGPETFANCPTVQYASRTSWAVKAGHGCIGCAMPGFWDAMGPAYQRLPAALPFAPNVSADQIGLALVGGVAAVTATHGAATYGRELRNRFAGRRRRANVALVDEGPAVAVREMPAAAEEPAPVERAPVEPAPVEPEGVGPTEAAADGQPILDSVRAAEIVEPKPARLVPLDVPQPSADGDVAPRPRDPSPDAEARP
jgi:hydrogenase small subunit